MFARGLASTLTAAHPQIPSGRPNADGGAVSDPECVVRPCVARGFHRSVGFAVLHQCIRPLIGARCAAGPRGYQARMRSH
jgi:hypothetical protein